ncbi:MULTISPECIES: ROK family transcriptional regulator [Tepidanaerobacter]|uniref:Sugar kinase of the NBD/HSP70 family n=2 Tax=Tepidanaerobacter syntrophicus TaxID=224999 RepID=A0A0U9HFW7_9FIRM|nr:MULTISPECIES: ROK family transcriptional regulator [Tepidanaerobacter]GAQ25035.1 sugar kinase of the NBD/HSP70 family [Tepidanaerobacter syntrophicus]GLI20258.1 transcriptional regulator [Tepidanaerobacter syntrophicus]HHV83886.1 ROK family transcriptional regulator [Tepidanaerobacter syntrophicus]
MGEFDLDKFKTIATPNDCLVLNTIRHQGPISRADIAKATNLTAPAITYITNKLLDSGIVTEHTIGQSSGGRRPILLAINPDTLNVLVIHISSNRLRGYLVDGELNVISEKEYSVQKMAKDDILELMLSTILDLKKDAKTDILGIGVVVHGPVQSKEGISLFAPNLGWRNVPIKYIVEEKIGLPTFVENDVRAMAIGEFYYGSASDIENMVFLKVGYGIGSAIFIDGKLYRGCGDSAGEIGHTTIDVGGPLCSCGNYGCLEAVASENALVKSMIKSIKEGRSSMVQEMAGGNLEDITPEMIYEAAEKNDNLAGRFLRQTARYLGIGIANAINTFNPELLVIGGGIVKAKSSIEKTMLDTVKDRCLENSFNQCKIEFSQMGEIATIKGAADVVMTAIF